MDVEAGYVHQPSAIDGDKAGRVIKSMQVKFGQRGDNLLGLVNQFTTDLERDSSELCQSIDDSHDRVFEVGDVIEVNEKLDAIVRACDRVRVNLARSNQRFKRKTSALEQAKESLKDMSQEDRQSHLEKNRDLATEQKNKRVKESESCLGNAPHVIHMEDGRGSVVFDDRGGVSSVIDKKIEKFIAKRGRQPATITQTVQGVTNVAIDESSVSLSEDDSHPKTESGDSDDTTIKLNRCNKIHRSPKGSDIDKESGVSNRDSASSESDDVHLMSKVILTPAANLDDLCRQPSRRTPTPAPKKQAILRENSEHRGRRAFSRDRRWESARDEATSGLRSSSRGRSISRERTTTPNFIEEGRDDLMREYARKAIVADEDRMLVVKSHAIQLAEARGNLGECARLKLCVDHYIIGDQRELDEAGICTPPPKEREVPIKPSYNDRYNGEEFRGVQDRMQDKKEFLRAGGHPRESELDTFGIQCSLFVSGINGVSENQNFMLVDYYTHGAVQSGAITCGSISRDPDGMMLGPTWLRCLSPAIRDEVWSLLEGRDAWVKNCGAMSIIVCHPSRHAVIPSNANRREHASPIGVVWPFRLLIDTPENVIQLDSGGIRLSESRMCSWCSNDGHQALECPLLKRMKESLVAKGEDGMYRCERCQAIDTHLTKNCTRPTDYGFARKEVIAVLQRPSVTCHNCGEPGHIARRCPKSVCYNCGRLGHHAGNCTNPTQCYVCGVAHSARDCHEARDIRARGSNDA